jgi:hypothetical protein
VAYFSPHSPKRLEKKPSEKEEVLIEEVLLRRKLPLLSPPPRMPAFLNPLVSLRRGWSNNGARVLGLQSDGRTEEDRGGELWKVRCELARLFAASPVPKEDADLSYTRWGTRGIDRTSYKSAVSCEYAGPQPLVGLYRSNAARERSTDTPLSYLHTEPPKGPRTSRSLASVKEDRKRKGWSLLSGENLTLVRKEGSDASLTPRGRESSVRAFSARSRIIDAAGR